MATLSNNRGTGGHSANTCVPYLLEEVIDYNTQGAAAADVIEAVNVPAGSLVLFAGVEVITADSAGNSGTLALGDGTVTYVAATAPTTVGQIANADAVAEMCVAYSAANTLDVTGATGTVNGKVRVWAIVMDYTSPDVTQRAVFA